MDIATLLGHGPRLTFGHDAAQFQQLVAFLAAVSLVLWAFVLLTIVVRIWMCHVWYRYRRPASQTTY